MKPTRYKQEAKIQTPKSPKFDLGDRTFRFAQDVRRYVSGLPRDLIRREDVSQLIRSSGAGGANYIEANDALGKKDYIMRIKIARKEAKESRYWLRLMPSSTIRHIEEEGDRLVGEAKELTCILSAIVNKSMGKKL